MDKAFRMLLESQFQWHRPNWEAPNEGNKITPIQRQFGTANDIVTRSGIDDN